MAEIAAGQAGDVSFRIDAPGWLAGSGAFADLFRAQAPAKLAALGRQMEAAAGAAYAGTRFERSFAYAADYGPYEGVLTLRQSNPLFPYIEEPTRPHTIEARNGPYLRFQVGGEWVFAHSVHHPGTKGKLKMPAIKAEYAARFKQVLEEIVREALSGK